MESEKKYTIEEILEMLRSESFQFNREVTTPHLSWEEIFQYLERRNELSENDPQKQRVLNHITECHKCCIAFSYAHELVTSMENGSVVESTEESQRKAYVIALITYHEEEGDHLTLDQEIGYLEDTLSNEQKAEVNAHLQICDLCRMGMEAAKRALTDFDNGVHKDEPVPRRWIDKAIEVAEREWNKAGK